LARGWEALLLVRVPLLQEQDAIDVADVIDRAAEFSLDCLGLGLLLFKLHLLLVVHRDELVV